MNMAFNREYGEAAVEVLDILDNTNEEDVKKIPSSFIRFLVDNASEEYVCYIDHSKPISELNIKEKTKEILGTIYINWWCNENQKEEYKKKINEKEKNKQDELREKYNIDNIFENKKKKQSYIETMEKDNKQDEILAVVKYKDNIFKRIINRILQFFKG